MFSIIYLIRIRFFGPGELIHNIFRAHSNPHTKVETLKRETSRWTLLWCLAPTLQCLPTLGFSFLGTLQCQVRPRATGRHPEDWLSGVPSVQSAVQAADTSEVVASFADAHTSVSVLAEPALPSDVTAAEGLAFSAAILLWFYGTHVSPPESLRWLDSPVVSGFCGRTLSWLDSGYSSHDSLWEAFGIFDTGIRSTFLQVHQLLFCRRLFRLVGVLFVPTQSQASPLATRCSCRLQVLCVAPGVQNISMFLGSGSGKCFRVLVLDWRYTFTRELWTLFLQPWASRVFEASTGHLTAWRTSNDCHCQDAQLAFILRERHRRTRCRASQFSGGRGYAERNP